jgi:hypothetical protein
MLEPRATAQSREAFPKSGDHLFEALLAVFERQRHEGTGSAIK